MPSEPRRHHTVPKSYLDWFCWPDGKLWIYDREKREFRGNQGSNQLTTVRDFYAFPKTDGTLDYTLEKAISAEIEGPFASVLAKLTKEETLSEDDQKKMVTFATLQHFRTKRAVDNLTHIFSETAKEMAIANLGEPEKAERIINKMKEDWKMADITPEDLTRMIRSDDFKLMPHRAEMMATTMKFFRNFDDLFHGFKRYLIRAGGSSIFITSDHPTAVRGPYNQKAWFMEPEMEFTLPLNTKWCLMLNLDVESGPREPWEPMPIVEASDEEVAQINERSVSESDRYVIWPTEESIKLTIKSSRIDEVPRGPTVKVDINSEEWKKHGLI